MAENVKVNARKRFFFGGRLVGPGEIEVPAEKVERLTGKGLIDAPAMEAPQTREQTSTQPDMSLAGEMQSSETAEASEAPVGTKKKSAKKGK